ncbi:MAG TPA: NUDIX domain-containing protein [Patescibacteria group bacterium]|nr:NUDIX domain-containing protein [Patescibacteria group bacterium]
MFNTLDGSVILLTYKGKILLITQNNNQLRPTQETWCFISGVKEDSQSFEEAIVRRVANLTHIELPQVELLSRWVYRERKKYFYRAQLTDKDVNNIFRDEWQAIDFFTAQEIGKMQLTNLTKIFMEKHKDLFQELSPIQTPSYSTFS